MKSWRKRQKIFLRIVDEYKPWNGLQLAALSHGSILLAILLKVPTGYFDYRSVAVYLRLDTLPLY